MTFLQTGESAAAELLDADAPAVCELFWDPLPIDPELIHGMYSGAEVFALIDNPALALSENMVQLPLPWGTALL